MHILREKKKKTPQIFFLKTEHDLAYYLEKKKSEILNSDFSFF